MEALDSAFRKSLWFTRGWTLQELLAPKTVKFYSRDWQYLTTKSGDPQIISEVTGIGQDVLMLHSYTRSSVASRMSWAGRRQTTKVEDLAYCLMGLFDVSMPLLYGEGEKAFWRLQQEILKDTTDHTIFSWKGDGYPSGMFARSPADFVSALDMSKQPSGAQNSASSLTNRGLRIELPLVPTPVPDMYAAVLNCC
ncbi:hypothetical protein SBRCBS47491_000237 [Sporothrix bragantina]|uniref:Heterokaryon incompatibility domain-containing protein n=1 Tax=Sporothrix bragantina TaxID=671064 RepID=A0ABP0ANJ3_9PEZI